MKKIGFLMMCIWVLAGCTTHYATNDKQQYLTSRNGPTIEVPPPLTHENISGFYDLPTPERAAKVSVAPPKDV